AAQQPNEVLEPLDGSESPAVPLAVGCDVLGRELPTVLVEHPPRVLANDLDVRSDRCPARHGGPPPAESCAINHASPLRLRRPRPVLGGSDSLGLSNTSRAHRAAPPPVPVSARNTSPAFCAAREARANRRRARAQT